MCLRIISPDNANYYWIRLITVSVIEWIQLLFVKSAKILSLGLVFAPFAGCAIGTGLVYAALLRAVAYAPDMEDILFGYSTLAFAFIETFALILVGVAGAIYSM
jgi:F0F1-type ATP synthase membrane subunit c/vacuolar-type H+-ATPase subunit K